MTSTHWTRREKRTSCLYTNYPMMLKKGMLILREIFFFCLEAGVLKVIAEDFIKPDCVEKVMPLYRELLSATRKEPLCIAYELYIDEKDPGHFIFIEEWPDRAALELHCESEHFRRLVPLIDQHKRQDPQYILMNSLVKLDAS